MVEILKRRTKAIGVEGILLSKSIEHSRHGDVVARQFIRSATSVGANYRAAARAKSTADYIHKLKIVEEEADETLYWLEVSESCGLLKSGEINDLRAELNEIIAIIVATIKTLRAKINNHKN